MKLGAGFSLASTVTLGIEDSGTQITLAVGDELRIVLPGKESPGCGWVLTPGDPRVIDVATAGAGEFTFVAKGTGSTRLVFAYRHPWERKTPIKTVTLDVQVGRLGGWLPKVMAGVGAAVVVADGVLLYRATRKKKR